MTEQDKHKFLTSLYILNDRNSSYLNVRKYLFPAYNRDLVSIGSEREPYVRVMCFALMPNHYHLILEQLVDNGISEFMHKLSVSYSMFFNIKYERVGSLFQGTFKAKGIGSDGYLMDLTRYIHLNPIVHNLQNGLSWPKVKKLLTENNDTSYKYYMMQSSYNKQATKETENSIVDLGLLRSYFLSTDDYDSFLRQRMLERFGELAEWVSH